ncbi:MAG: ATPase, T2SS/T4P/T4SS family [bacterium]
MSISFDDKSQNKRVDELRKQEEEGLVEMLATEKYNIPYINLAGVVIENEALRAFDEKDAHDMEVAPFKLAGNNLHIALHSPAHTDVALLTANLIKKGYVPHIYMASIASLTKVWERYRELSNTTVSREGGIDITGDTLLALGTQIKTIDDIRKIIEQIISDGSQKKTSRMLEIILAGAISIDASDIHIEPEHERIRLRYRLDGVLQDVAFFDEAKFRMIDSRIKLISGLKLTQTDQAQDGRFSIFISGDEIGIRTSIIPSAYGEGIVMRLLNPKATKVKFEDLGIEPKLFKILDHEIKKPNGLMLITGPTGSGKTTTLYSFLRRIYDPELKILTIEDPIEYHLAGITQTQTEIDKGYGFPEGLRAALRQDPDVIMVGEIRDKDTATIAINAALTGHLVFSTLHTNNAAGVIPRLIDLGINPKILTSALTISVAQRLIRKVCKYCATDRDANENEKNIFSAIITQAIAEGKDMASYNVSADMDMKVKQAVGCEKCSGTGYKGRIGVFEAILTDQSIEDIVNKNPSEREIKKASETQHILDMKEDAVVKILNGVTTYEEAVEVVDFDED